MTISILSLAQTKSKNSFGLVYEDAITQNVKEKVNIHPVTYKLNGLNIAAISGLGQNWQRKKQI